MKLVDAGIVGQEISAMVIKPDKKIIRLFNIRWCTDEQSLDLPNDVFFEVGSDFDTDLEAADLLSDNFDFLVDGFEFKEFKHVLMEVMK